MAKIDPNFRLCSRALLETTAQIIGDASAAAQALADADSHVGPVRFYKGKGMFIVEKLPVEPAGDE